MDKTKLEVIPGVSWTSVGKTVEFLHHFRVVPLTVTSILLLLSSSWFPLRLVDFFDRSVG